MSTPFFRFQQFLVRHDRCAMKVGTDGVLLGAWARGGERILDIGTGTGLIALMMAQRYEHAMVDAVEIDAEACLQAEENVADSPFANRIHVVCDSIQQFAMEENHHSPSPQKIYDAIVSNPPFFENALKNPDKGRLVARHSDTLPFSDLFKAVKKLLADEGEFSVVIPTEYRGRIEEEALLQGFSLARICAIKTTPRKPIRRYLLAFRRHPSANIEENVGILETQPNVRSEWYENLTKDFYIKRH